VHLEVIVEEPSAEVALGNLLPMILGGRATFAIHPYGGKPSLLAALPNRFRGYGHWLPPDRRIVVLIDEDRQDCHELKARLERAAARAELLTKTAARPGEPFQVVNRLAIEELEAWFFGDIEALVAAYPKLPATLGDRSPYRHPDAIRGGTWEALERELQRVGYYPSGLPKVEVARRVSAQMDPSRNRSRSFQVFREAIAELVGR
jgi:hypothetical protein